MIRVAKDILKLVKRLHEIYGLKKSDKGAWGTKYN